MKICVIRSIIVKMFINPVLEASKDELGMTAQINV